MANKESDQPQVIYVGGSEIRLIKDSNPPVMGNFSSGYKEGKFPGLDALVKRMNEQATILFSDQKESNEGEERLS